MIKFIYSSIWCLWTSLCPIQIPISSFIYSRHMLLLSLFNHNVWINVIFIYSMQSMMGLWERETNCANGTMEWIMLLLMQLCDTWSAIFVWICRNHHWRESDCEPTTYTWDATFSTLSNLNRHSSLNPQITGAGIASLKNSRFINIASMRCGSSSISLMASETSWLFDDEGLASSCYIDRWLPFSLWFATFTDCSRQDAGVREEYACLLGFQLERRICRLSRPSESTAISSTSSGTTIDSTTTFNYITMAHSNITQFNSSRSNNFVTFDFTILAFTYAKFQLIRQAVHLTGSSPSI